MPRERRTVPDPYVYDVKYREDTRGIVACFLRYAGVSERGRARGEARARTHDSPNDQSTKQGPSLHSGMHTQPRIDASPSSRKIEGRGGRSSPLPVRIESIRALRGRPIVLGNACPYERDAPLFIANKEPTCHHLILSRVYIYRVTRGEEEKDAHFSMKCR